MDKAKLELEDEYYPAGYNLGLNDGVGGGRTIMHVHFHLIPRYEGDRADARGEFGGYCRRKRSYWK
jgi:diadenosine tetraphosphate (Ap4A) HIT family hydrolase